MAAELQRCAWCGTDPLYVSYHDQEWGVPLHDDQRLFEFLTLESAQAGLSWITILRKRENYRKAFANFDPVKVARFSEKKFEKLMQDSGIIRNTAKVRAAIHNAGRFLDVQAEFGSFDAYNWQFVDGRAIQNKWKTLKQIPAVSSISEKFSKDLKQRGFKFLGPTTVYAHMQATGMVNDHLACCFRYHEV